MDIHLGRNPISGGTPAKDKISKDIIIFKESKELLCSVTNWLIDIIYIYLNININEIIIKIYIIK